MWGSGNPKINAYEPLNYLFLQDLGFTTDLPGPLEILCLLGSLAQNCLLVLGKYVVGSVFSYLWLVGNGGMGYNYNYYY